MNYLNPLTVKVVRDGRICVLTLSGDLDILAVPGLLKHAAQNVDEARVPQLNASLVMRI